MVKPEPRRPPRAAAVRAVRGAGRPAGLGPLSLLCLCHRRPSCAPHAAAVAREPAGILPAPGRAPRSHLLQVPQGLCVGEGTHLQIAEETRLHQGVRLGARGAAGAPRLGWHRLLIAFNPQPSLGSWQGARRAAVRRAKCLLHTQLRGEERAGEAQKGTGAMEWGMQHALPAMCVAPGSTAGTGSLLQGSLRRAAHGHPQHRAPGWRDRVTGGCHGCLCTRGDTRVCPHSRL